MPGRNVSGLIGILYTSAGFGTLIGPAAAGFAFDFAHSYLTPILTSAISNVIAAIVMVVTSSHVLSVRSSSRENAALPTSDFIAGVMSRATRPPRLKAQEAIGMRGIVAWILGIGLAVNGLIMLAVPAAWYAIRQIEQPNTDDAP